MAQVALPDLGFGIPSLDALFGHRRMVMREECGFSPSTSFCLAGPPGTGKSILALHFASTYRADHRKCRPRIIYISTDFSYAKADRVWSTFALKSPHLRKDPFPKRVDDCRIFDCESSLQINLRHCPADKLANQVDDPEGIECLWKPGEEWDEVLFVDLNSSRSGDEWDFVNRLLSILPEPEDNSPRHLVVVDAVEGLEMFVGNRDPHGEERSRRSRITQLLRTANGKAHLFFVVENGGTGLIPPEEFLTDFVLRTHVKDTRGYDRRSIEVVKARAQWHFRGQHIFVIRDGKGTSVPAESGEVFNFDDPKHRGDDDLSASGYVHVMHSLHGLYRDAMRISPRIKQPVERRENPPYWIGFGIPFLDELLGVDPGGDSPQPSNQGLPKGKVTALIGDPGTHKRRLSRAFLAGCFDFRQLQGAGILISLSSYTIDDLARRILQQPALADKEFIPPANAIDEVRHRLIYRKLELHDISSAVFIHIVKCAVIAAKQRLQVAGLFPIRADQIHTPQEVQSSAANTDELWNPQRIRVVIDSWSTLAATYPDLESDPLVLPYLLDFLQAEGVTTLLIDNLVGGPRSLHGDKRHQDLCTLTQHQIYTWRVPFFGEQRIAISAVPPLSDTFPPLTRELRRSAKEDDETLWVDPHFEIYSGMERSNPQPVALQLRLYAKTDAFDEYASVLQTLFREPFVSRNNQQIVVSNRSDEYEALRFFCHVQSDSRLDYTLVFEVDEFWMQQSARTELMDLRKYLLARTDDFEAATRTQGVSRDSVDSFTAVNDPFGQFRGDVNKPVANTSAQRFEYFTRRGYEFAKYLEHEVPIDRVPFMWDFGFLMVDVNSWDLAKQDIVGPATEPMTIGTILDACKNETSCISWRCFMEACKKVADVARKNSSFECDMRAAEALSCLVLEMWFSEIFKREPIAVSPYTSRNPGQAIGNNVQPRKTLIELLGSHHRELYRVLLLLGDVLDCSQIVDSKGDMISRPATTDAVAVRHWYSTATSYLRAVDAVKGKWLPLRLPGHFSVRGDWFLAIAKGSRSERLGWHALDLLASRRENVRRLQMGLGLPTRDYLPSDDSNKISTRSHRFPTALKCWDVSTSRYDSMTYGDIIESLGARDNINLCGSPKFQWLFRSAIRKYSTHSRVWGKWLSRVLSQWQFWRSDSNNGSINGFQEYDAALNQDNSCWQKFDAECEYVRAALASASFAP